MMSKWYTQQEEHPVVYNAQIFDLNSSVFTLNIPLLVVIEVYSEEVIARVPEFAVYASGISEPVALMNLKSEIISTYERDEELGEEKLAAVALQSFLAMRKVIGRTAD